MKRIYKILCIVCIATTGLINNSCDNMEFDNVEYQDYLMIKGDLGDPTVLNSFENNIVIIEAAKRIRSYLTINDGLLTIGRVKASDLNISEEIFSYILESYNETNILIKSGKVHAFYHDDEVKVVWFYYIKMSNEEIVNFFLGICQTYHPSGNLDDYFDLSSVPYNGGQGYDHYSIDVTLDGTRYECFLLNACGVFDNPDDCSSNDFMDNFEFSNDSYIEYYAKNYEGAHILKVRIWE